MKIESEIWRKVSSVPGLEASSKGRIRTYIDRGNKVRAGYIYRARTNKDGYLNIRFTIDKKRRHFFVSRLVCEAFNGTPTSAKLHAAHKDGNPAHNKPKNLRWSTPKKNIDDREKHGRTMRGDKHYAAILSIKDVRKIRLMLSAGVPQTQIANKFGVTNHAIFDIKRKKSWKRTK